MSTNTKTFASGNSIAVRLLGDCRLPEGTMIREHREGNKIILELVDEWSPEFIALAGSCSDELPRPKWSKARDPFA